MKFSDAPLDSILKTHLLCDILNIASVPLVRERNINNHCAIDEEESQEETNQLQDDLCNVNSSVAAVSDLSVTSDCNYNLIDSTNDIQLKPRPSSATGNYCADKGNEKNELLHSDSCSAFSTSSGTSLAATRKRKLLNTRASKVRKAQLTFKPTFSANSITPQYLARAKCHFDKLELEFQRKGRFIRVFPRATTWELYKFVQ